MDERLPERPRRGRKSRIGMLLTAVLAALLAAGTVAAGRWEEYRRRTQMQNDPRVARVWTIGTTFGPHHEVVRGTNLQRWLNSRNIHLLGDYEVIQGQFANDPGSLEIWFNYESYLIGVPDLECHRVQANGTAFIDDLGQIYHGYLDIHGKTVGVYLPGYDHSAHEIRCMLKWQPRKPAPPIPISRATVFTINLPAAKRVLPAADALPRTVTASSKGVTVTAGQARLGPFKQYSQSGQRDLTFHLKIVGGDIANDNVAADLRLSNPDEASVSRLRAVIGTLSRVGPRTGGLLSSPLQAQRQLLAFTNSTYYTPMTVSDPYGLPLVVPGQSIQPLISKDLLRSARLGEGVTWVVPVNGAGRGTDVVHLHFEVAPKPKPGRASFGPPVPFDLILPTQTGDEI